MINKPPQTNPKYSSANIKTPKPNYFVRIRQNHFLRRLFQKINSKPHYKIIWFCIVILTIIIIVVSIIFILNQQGSNNNEQDPNTSTPKTISEIYKEATIILQADSDSAYFDAIDIFDKAIENCQSDNSCKNEMTFAKAQFLSAQGAYSDALGLLLELNEKLANEDLLKNQVLIDIRTNYQDLEQYDESNYWNEQYNQLYSEGE